MSDSNKIIVKSDLTRFLQKDASYSLAQLIVNKLLAKGYKSYFAGGCVRDAIIGRTFKDIDIATQALPDEIEEIFPGATIPVGKKFGIIIVNMSGYQIEVATFRKDGPYQDGRRPQSIEFSDEKEDALRRDFTVNALFYDPTKFEIIDYVGGLSDISKKILRTVGNPDQRFSEDYLRVLRLFRFSEVLGFQIDKETLKSALDKRSELDQISVERKREELLKVFFSVSDQQNLVKKFQEYGLWFYLLGIDYLSVPSGLFSQKITEEYLLMAVLLWEVQDNKEKVKTLKPSQKVVQFVLKVLEYKNKISFILSQSESEKRFLCLRKEFSSCLRLMLLLDPNHKEMTRLLEISEEYLESSPKPLLTGEDLKNQFQGKRLGIALDLVFKEQLVQNWQSKEEALKWILNQQKV